MNLLNFNLHWSHGKVTATARPPTLPNDHVTSQPPNAIGLGGQAKYSQMNDMPALDFTRLDFQDISISSDTHPREIDNTIMMQIVLSTDSACMLGLTIS